MYIFTALVLPNPLFAQLAISNKDKVANKSPGFCMWASIETLARTHKINKLYDLMERRAKESNAKKKENDKWVWEPFVLVEHGDGELIRTPNNIGNDWAVYRKLNEMEVKYKMQWSGTYKTEIIDYAMSKQLGCVFAVRGGALGKESPAHAMILTSFNDKEFTYVDPNDTEFTYRGTRQWFDQNWTGFVLVLEK